MKKKLTLLIFSLLCTLGLWAQVTADVTIINGSTDPGTLGTFSDLSTNYSTWTAANGVKITNEEGKYALNKDASGDGYGKCLTINFTAEDLSHTITMTAPDHMKIAGYKFYAKGSTGSLTFTMTGGTPTSISALTYTKFEKTGLNDQEVSFGITASKAGALWISELTLTLVAESGYYTLYKIYYDGSEVANSDFYAQSSVDGNAPSLDVRYKRGYCDYTYYSDAELTSSLATISSNDIVYVKCQLSAGCPVEFSTLGSPVYYTILAGRAEKLYSYIRYLKNNSGAIAHSTSHTEFTISNLWAFIGNPYSFQLYNFEQKGYLYCPNVVQNGSTLSVGETGSNLTLFDNSSNNASDDRSGKVAIAFRSDGTGLLNCADNYAYYYAHGVTRDASGAINNMGFAYFILNKVTNYAPYISQYISSINSNYTSAGNVGYPKTSSTGYTALKTKIDGFSGETSYTLSDYNAFETAYATYTNETDVVKPSVGKFYTIYSPNANKYIHSVTPDNTLALNTSGTSADAIFYIIDSNARFLSYSNGYAMGAIKIWNTTYSSGGYYTYSIDHVATQDFGTLRINYSSYSFFQNGSTVGNTSQAATRTGEKAAWIFTEVTSLPITMHEVSGAYYATIKLPVAVEIPSGLSAYSAVADGTTLTLTKVVENGVLAANTPVILYSESDVESLTISNKTGTSPAGTNELSGTIDAASVTANANYVLSSGSEGVGFYKYNNTVMPGFKAYLSADAKSNVKAFTFSFEDAEDAIRAIESENSGLEIYDISGRRVQKAQKGLYIVNGKKVMFK
jgi:hypothetical protein